MLEQPEAGTLSPIQPVRPQRRCLRNFSIAANVCAADTGLIKHTVPHWLRVFNERLSEILLVVDERVSTGRIARQHSTTFQTHELYAAIDQLTDCDSRVKCLPLDYGTAAATGQKWFREPNVLRCQSGTPIFAFVRAVEEASGDLVMRTDADMLFCDNGWLDCAAKILDEKAADLVEPPKLGMDSHPTYQLVSSRVFLLKPADFVSSCLPLKPHRLDWPRRFHRLVAGRSSLLALEEIIQKEKLRKRVRHRLLNSNLGFSLHVSNRHDANMDYFRRVVSLVESNAVPERQSLSGWNLALDVWALEGAGWGVPPPGDSDSPR